MPGGDLNRYKAGRDWGSEGDARRAMYDLQRDSGIPREAAAKWAEKGARQFAAGEAGEKKAGDAAAPPARASAEAPRSRFRVPFPWETPPVP